jgi:dolichyl-phosphate-mannose--protein O-mannosyl transferase
MTLSKKLSNLFIPWFGIGLTAIFLLSVALRFWRLSQFNTLVFDEVYYAKFSNNYLTGTHFFNAHPPLSQYIIAIGIWIGSHLPFGQDTVNGLTGSLRSTWSYRWINALTGSYSSLSVCRTCLSTEFGVAPMPVIEALFAALIGLFMVESRYELTTSI